MAQHLKKNSTCMETMNKILQAVRDYADQAHGEQMRKYEPKRYIVHPEEVMEICREYTDELPVLAAALLHDVLEDTPVKEHDIAKFLEPLMSQAEAKEALNLTVDLTDMYTKQAYPHLNRRQRKDKENERLSKAAPKAQTIKYADIISNAVDITAHDKHFGRVYLQEMETLLSVMKSGNKDLYRRAVETIRACKLELKMG